MNSELVVSEFNTDEYRAKVQIALEGLLQELSPNSRRLYRTAVFSYFKFAIEGGYIQRGVPHAAILSSYLGWLRDEGKSGRTIVTRRIQLRRFFEWAVVAGLIAEMDNIHIHKVKAPKVQGNKAGRWLTYEQIQKLLNAPDVSTPNGRRDLAALSVFVGCALRRSEVCNLKWGQLVKQGEGWVILDLERKHGKTQPYVPVPGWTMQAVDMYSPRGKEDECVFTSIDKYGHRADGITPDALYKMVREYCERLGFGKITPHDLRRSVARLHKQKGTDISQIQLLLGHADPKTTSNYINEIMDISGLANAFSFEVSGDPSGVL